MLGCLTGCSDPPAPPPVDPPAGIPRWSEAPYVRWAGPADPVDRPLAVFIDQPGGPLDRVAAHPDVTTFLNDRFAPFFLAPEAAAGLPAAPAALWLDTGGCLLADPSRPADAAAWIAAANRALAHPPATRRPLDPEPTGWRFDLPPAHPLRGRCATSGADVE